MTAYVGFILGAILIAAAYSSETPSEHTLNIGEVIQTSVETLSLPDSLRCYLETPNNVVVQLRPENEADPSKYEVRTPNFLVGCAVTITITDRNDNGLWRLYAEFDNGAEPVSSTYLITVNDAEESSEIQVNDIEWVYGKSVNKFVGPADAVYCKIVSPSHSVVSEQFGPCHINLDRAEHHHAGAWQLTVGTPGKIRTELQSIYVTIVDPERRISVITTVNEEEPEITLTCTLPGVHELRTCKFRDPYKRVLLAAKGVEEDRYTYHEVESETNSTSCGLRIKNVVTEDQGIWRCAMETTTGEIYHGFLTVVSPWAMTDLSVAAAIVTKPILTASSRNIESVEGEDVSVLCSIHTQIRYCYFRSVNGTILSVTPGTKTDDVEYVGSGFEAGECGIKFKRFRESFAGEWSCNVGEVDPSEPEQKTFFTLDYIRAIEVRHIDFGPSALRISGLVYKGNLDYCRFVRSDGLGFAEFSQANGYITNNNLEMGVCDLTVYNPLILDRRPWTVVARTRGDDNEISATTRYTMPPRATSYGYYIWVFCMTFGLLLIALSLSRLSEKRNKQWIKNKATALRNSFRFKKTTTPNAPSAA